MPDAPPEAAGESIAAATVIWDDDQCLSADHGDRYFSPDAALEVERVFMRPAALITRIQALPAQGASTFTCAETGFGTGLNAAVVIETFLAYAPANARLHFISFERMPLTAEDMHLMAQRFQARLPIYKQLDDAYPPRLSGWHRLHLGHGTARNCDPIEHTSARITLSLYFGDAEQGLTDIQHRQQLPVDHWLLDGFAPQKNPSLWQLSLFQLIADLSARGTTVATYTAVGEVRRGLQSVGFAMRKVDQMPIKLHSLAGTFEADSLKPFAPAAQIQIIGAGIAGVSVARGLADRGLPVTLVEPTRRIAGHASRIPAAVLHGRLRDDGTADAAWQAMSYHYSHHRMLAFAGFKATGARQISGPNTNPAKLAALYDRYASSGNWLELASSPNTRWRHAEAALRFNIGGVVHGPTLCRSLADHPLITHSAKSIEADITVLANGFASRNTSAAGYLEIAALAGQAELCSHPSPPSEAIVGAGYMAPCKGGMVVGSTYEYRPWHAADALEANLAPWQNTGRHRASFRAHRTITSDRVCIVGKLYDRERQAIDSLRITTGFGSTGMSSAPLAGECIAAELAGEFAPITKDLQNAISSVRFRLRQARRGPRMDADPA